MSKFLVVDDDADIRETLKTVLELLGHEVAVAADGREALTRLAELPPPSLILLDLRMPGMNGWDFVAALRADSRLAALPVVVLSGDAALAQTAGGLGLPWLKKPVDVSTLQDLAARYA